MKNHIALIWALSGGLASGVLLDAATPVPTIKLSPATAQLRAGEQKTFNAITTGISKPATVVWKVVSTGAAPAGTLGTIAGVGDAGFDAIYKAPAAVPTPGTVLVQGTYSADSRIFATATVTILSPLPAITSISDRTINTGLPYALEIKGSNFEASSEVLFDGVTVPSTFSAGSLHVTGKSMAGAGSKINVTVSNPGPAAVSGATALTVVAPVQVTVTPDTATVRMGKTQQFSARVANSEDTVVVWQVNGKTGGDATRGVITDKGLYTAPATMPVAMTVTVGAVSHADATAKDTTVVTLENAAPAIMSLSPSNINTGLAYTVQINGTAFLSGSKVKFDGVVVPSKFISSTNLEVSGLSTLAAGKTLAVTVESPGANAASGPRNLTVVAPVAVQITPDTKTIRVSQTVQFSARVVDNADQVVAWQVNGKAKGDATVGTIDDKGLYTAPAILPVVTSPAVTGNPAVATMPTVSITAISHADPKASHTAVLTLENALPVITGVGPNPLLTSASTVTVDGTGFAQGAVVMLGGVHLTTTFVSDKKLTATGQITMPLGRAAGVKVTNPSPGGATSAAVVVQVRPAVEKMAYADAVRFLEMASWGPTPASVEHLQSIGRDAWLQEQFAIAPSAWPDPFDGNEGAGRLQDAFFTNALTGPDQLRQRVAFAISKVMVVSAFKDTHFAEMVSYQRVLAGDAFKDFRTLLGDITLNPAMGHYLDMVNNDKANPAKNTVANENYAREVMQLFTVGINRLDNTGATVSPVPEYSEATVAEMAKVFTGWTYPAAPGFAGKWTNPEYNFLPMVPFEAHHDTTQKLISLPAPCTIPAGGTAANDLNQALDCLANQTNVAPFISYRLIQSLVTSSPSAAYLSRVSAAFHSSDGDLKAVVTAILNDQEAAAPGTVKLREPVLYSTTLLRALNATVTTTATGVRNQTFNMGQDVMAPASVFSYFSPFSKVAVPNFPASGAVTVQVAPEFQGLNAATSFGRINFAWQAAVNQLSGNIKVDFTSLQDLAATPVVLADAIDQALYRGQMDSGEKTAVLAGINAATDSLNRVRNGIYVAAAAPQYQVEQ
jgi:uncharacterized protein (DUF1800 family)